MVIQVFCCRNVVPDSSRVKAYAQVRQVAREQERDSEVRPEGTGNWHVMREIRNRLTKRKSKPGNEQIWISPISALSISHEAELLLLLGFPDCLGGSSWPWASKVFLLCNQSN